jgi:hypothetical protein
MPQPVEARHARRREPGAARSRRSPSTSATSGASGRSWLERRPDLDEPEIAAVERPGYRLGPRLIRTARVSVAGPLPAR